MSTTTMRRRVAALAAGALGAGALAFVAPAPAAQADEAAPSFTWAFSQQVTDHLSSRTLADGATAGTGTNVVFPDGVGYHYANGEAAVRYEGSVTYAFPGVYSMTFSGLEVEVDASGHGAIKADVAWNISFGTASEGSADDLTLAEFDGATWDGQGIAATPNWAGVAPVGTYGEGLPLEGKSWNPEFVQAIDSGLRAHFYASGKSSDVKKNPAAFTATAPAVTAAPQLSVTQSTVTASGATVAVSGTDFKAVTYPEDAGVYVGIAPVGGLPDVSSQAGMSAFADAKYITPAQIAGGAFSTTLNPPKAKLDATMKYAVYTWQAHSHSTKSQDTVTALNLDFSVWNVKPVVKPIVKKAPVLTPTPTTKLKAGKKALITYNLGATATGTLKVVIKKGKRGLTATLRLSKGKGALAISKAQTKKLGKGTWKVTSTYAGNATVKAGTKVSTLKVT